MTKTLIAIAFALTATPAIAQKVKQADVPTIVRSALEKKYPKATAVTWEKEKGNFEANWGGPSNEDNSVIFSPNGQFIEQVVAIPVASLPSAITSYIKQHYP